MGHRTADDRSLKQVTVKRRGITSFSLNSLTIETPHYATKNQKIANHYPFLGQNSLIISNLQFAIPKNSLTVMF